MPQSVDTASAFFRRWAWLPLIACVVLLALALQRERRQMAMARVRAEQLDREVAAEAAATRHRVHPATAPVDARSNAPLAPVKSASSSEASGKTSRPKLPPGVLASFSDRNALGEPDYAAAIARRERRYAMGRNRYAVDALHLAPADAARLKDLLAAGALGAADAADVLDRMGNASGDLRTKATAAARADADAKIRALLGPEKYAEFQTQKAIATTEQTNWALFTDFADAGVPLTPDQKTALARSMVDTGASQWVAAATTGRPPTEESHQRLLSAAAAFLSPDQLAFLRAHEAAEAQYRQAQNPPHP